MRILIVDDHPVMRLGVRHLVEHHWPGTTIMEAADLAEALQQVQGAQWDLVVLDLSLPDASGMEALVHVHRCAPKIPVLVWSMHDEASFAQHALRIGASGYLAKEHAAGELVTAIERVCAGGRYISTRLAEQIADQLSGQSQEERPHLALSAQEYRVLLMIAEGLSPSDMAEQMHLSVKTISTYRARIIEKTGLKGTAEIARYCEQHGLLGAR